VKTLRAQRIERSVIDQFVRSATAVGALVTEGGDCESRADMKHKFSISLKEARESQYWLRIIEDAFAPIGVDLTEINALLNEVIAMLVASRNTLSK